MVLKVWEERWVTGPKESSENDKRSSEGWLNTLGWFLCESKDSGLWGSDCPLHTCPSVLLPAVCSSSSPTLCSLSPVLSDRESSEDKNDTLFVSERRPTAVHTEWSVRSPRVECWVTGRQGGCRVSWPHLAQRNENVQAVCHYSENILTLLWEDSCLDVIVGVCWLLT